MLFHLVGIDFEEDNLQLMIMAEGKPWKPGEVGLYVYPTLRKTTFAAILDKRTL